MQTPRSAETGVVPLRQQKNKLNLLLQVFLFNIQYSSWDGTVVMMKTL